MKNFFRPIDILAAVGLVGLTIGAVGLEDCLMAWLLGMMMHSVGTDFTSRWRNRSQKI